MKVIVLKNRQWNMFAYVVSEIPEQYKNFFLSELYWPVENSFIKQFEGIQDMNVITDNFEKIGIEALEQMLKIRPTPWEEGLMNFANKISATGIDWYIHGSCAMALWGISVVPRNVDIIIPDLSRLEQVRQLFLNETIYPMGHCDNWVMGGIGGIFNKTNVSIAFHNIQLQPFDLSHLKEIEWNGINIRISPLEWLRRDNANYNRLERVKLIEEFMINA